MASRSVLALLLLAACSSSEAPRSPSPPCVEPPIGSPSEFVNAAGARIDPPKTCGPASGAYVRVYGEGKRTIAMGLEASKTACTEPPPAGSPESECPVIFADAFGRAVLARMASRGASGGGLGLGSCGDVGGDYDTWNYSVVIQHYRDLDIAVASVKDELDRWGVGHHFGISVRAPVCVEPILLEGAP